VSDSATDRILSVIDGGLQSSSETGSGIDLHPDLCARCQCHDSAEGGDLCAGCRAFLLGDSDASDSVAEVLPVALGGRGTVYRVEVRFDTSEFERMMARVSEAVMDTGELQQAMRRSVSIPPEFVERDTDDDHTRWHRRAGAARASGRPLVVTPEQYNEIRCLEPVTGVLPFDLPRETVYGVPLIIRRTTSDHRNAPSA